MRYDDRVAFLERDDLVECVLHDLLAVRNQCTGGIVEDGPRDSDVLILAARELLAFHAQLGVVYVRERRLTWLAY